MSDTIGSYIKRLRQEADALEHVAEKYGYDITSRDYQRGRIVISVWLVDMPLMECDNIHTFHPNREDWREGIAIIFKNVAQGVNIAPKNKHCINLSTLMRETTKDVESMKQLASVFERYGR